MVRDEKCENILKLKTIHLRTGEFTYEEIKVFLSKSYDSIVAFLCFFIKVQTVEAASPKVHNNGQYIVEYNNKVYHYQSGVNKGIYCYDLKKKKNTQIIPLDFKTNIWILKDCIYYTKSNSSISGSGNSLYKYEIRKKKTQNLYSSTTYGDIIGVNEKTSCIYYKENTMIKQIDVKGKCKKKVTIPTSDILEDTYTKGDVIVATDTGNIYYGTMKKGVKKLAQTSFEYSEILGIYGNYIYGYEFGNGGSMGNLYGSLFQVSIKTGQVKKMPDKYMWNDSIMVEGKIYADAMEDTVEDKSNCLL